MRHFTISVGEPWDFEGPDGPNRLLVTLLGHVDGPNATNWAKRYLLLESVKPFDFDGERVELLVAAPRNVGNTITSMETEGGTAGLARVRPGVKLIDGGKFTVEEVAYCMIGTLTPIPPNQSLHPEPQAAR